MVDKKADIIFKYDRFSNSMYIIQRLDTDNVQDIQDIFEFWKNNVLQEVKEFAEMQGLNIEYVSYVTEKDGKYYIITEIKNIPYRAYKRIVLTFKLLYRLFFE